MKVETDLPDEQLALIGCGVTTGVGAALNTAQVEPGSTVAVIGCGGVGPVGDPGRPHRRRVADLRGRPGGDEAQDRRSSSAPPISSTPPTATRSSRSGRSAAGRGADYAFEVIGLPRDDPAGLEHRPPGRDRRGRRHAPLRRRGDLPRLWGSSTTTSALLGCVYGSAQVRRDFPRFVQLVETRPARHRLDGVRAASPSTR